VVRGVAVGLLAALLAAGCAGEEPRGPSWHEMPPLLYARSAHAVTGDRETVYALGGTGADGEPVLAVERFDGRVWTRVATLPGSGLNAPAAVLLKEKLYVIGGFEATSNVPTDRVHVWDTKTRRWSEAAPLPAPRGGHAAAMLGGRIHVLGGGNESSTLAQHTVFDPVADSWRELAPLPTPRGSPAAVVVERRLWSLGGRSGADDFGDVDVYDPEGDAWAPGPGMPPRGTHGAVLFRGALHVFGGESQAGGRTLAAVLRLDPETERWQQVSLLPTPRSYARAVLHDDGVLVVGGSAAAGSSHASRGTKVVERYGPKP
jgi:N-acetylneuraminic acid mutarotase